MVVKIKLNKHISLVTNYIYKYLHFGHKVYCIRIMQRVIMIWGMRELEIKENWKVRNPTRDWTWDLLISTYLCCIKNSRNSTAKCTPRTKQKANNWQDNRKDEVMISRFYVLDINCFRGLDCNDSRICLILH